MATLPRFYNLDKIPKILLINFLIKIFFFLNLIIIYCLIIILTINDSSIVLITQCTTSMRYTELMSIAKMSINDRCKHGFLFFYTLLLDDETDIFFIPRSVIFFRDRGLFTRLPFLQYPRVTRQFRPLLWQTVSRRYYVKNILLHEQGTPPRDITITTHLVT